MLPQIVTQATDVVAMDADYLETSDEFEHRERRTILEREEVGANNRYSNMQPTSAPAIGKYLIGKRLDFSLHYFIDDNGTEIFWSQGEAILVSEPVRMS